MCVVFVDVELSVFVSGGGGGEEDEQLDKEHPHDEEATVLPNCSILSSLDWT